MRFILYAGATATVFFLFSIRPGVHMLPRATFPAMISGTAHRPFVLRALMPAVVRSCVSVMPASLRETITKSVAVKYSDLAHMFQWEDGWIIERAVASLLMYVCFLAFAFVLRSLTLAALPVQGFVADMTPIGALVFLPAFFRYTGFMYDPATLLFSGLALLFLFQGRFWKFYLAFIPAVLNKETSLVLIGLFTLFGKEEMERRSLLTHVGAQLLIWGLVRSAIYLAYAGNPGSVTEFHLIDHTLALLLQPSRLAYLFGVGGILLWLVGYRWREKPVLLRRAFLVTAAPLVLASLVFGYVEEFRVDYEAVPAAVLLGVLTVTRLFGDIEESPARS
jgi:hypothetical protein